jgi:hypothetical protein
MPHNQPLAELASLFGNADFARSALDVWAGFVTEPEVVTTADRAGTTPVAITRAGPAGLILATSSIATGSRR